MPLGFIKALEWVSASPSFLNSSSVCLYYPYNFVKPKDKHLRFTVALLDNFVIFLIIISYDSLLCFLWQHSVMNTYWNAIKMQKNIQKKKTQFCFHILYHIWFSDAVFWEHVGVHCIGHRNMLTCQGLMQLGCPVLSFYSGLLFVKWHLILLAQILFDTWVWDYVHFILKWGIRFPVWIWTTDIHYI